MARRQGRAADQYLMRLFTQGMGEQFSIGTTHDRQTLKRFFARGRAAELAEPK